VPIVKDAELVYVLFADNTDFYIHATFDVQPSFSSTVTSLEVETGANTTDHIRPEPIPLSLTGFMSELEGQTGDTVDPDFRGDHTAFDERMRAARLAGETISLDCGSVRGQYADMAIENYSPSWSISDDDGKSLNFSLQLKQISYAEAKRKKINSEPPINQSNVSSNANQTFATQSKKGNITLKHPSDSLTNKALRVKQPVGSQATGDWTRGPA